MKDDRYVLQLKELVLSHVDKEHHAVFLFGGRARGRSGKRIDVDIGLLGKTPIPIDLIGKLYQAVEESTIPLKVDFVDFSRVEDQFRNIALETIEIWNKPPTITIN